MLTWIFAVVIVLLPLGCANPSIRTVTLEPSVPNSEPSPFAQRLEPYKRRNPKWYDWQIQWQNVQIDAVAFRFKDFNTLHSFFTCYLCRRSVPTDEASFWDIPLLDTVARAACRLGIEEEYLKQEINFAEMTIYKMKILPDMILVHINARPKYVEALFRKSESGWYQLFSTIGSRHVRVWYPSFWILSGKSGQYLVVPNWQMGTGTGLHEENLRVYAMSPKAATLIVDEPVFSVASLYSWSYLVSSIAWDPKKDILSILKQATSGQIGMGTADRTVTKVIFDLREPESRTSQVLRKEAVNVDPKHDGIPDSLALVSSRYKINIE